LLDLCPHVPFADHVSILVDSDLPADQETPPAVLERDHDRGRAIAAWRPDDRRFSLTFDGGWPDLKPYRPLGSVVDGNGR
jgi:hypothetical protein